VQGVRDGGATLTPEARPVVPSRPRPRQHGVLPELVDETVETPIEVDAVHDVLAQLLLQAYRARRA
jgi:hypothetical protein